MEFDLADSIASDPEVLNRHFSGDTRRFKRTFVVTGSERLQLAVARSLLASAGELREGERNLPLPVAIEHDSTLPDPMAVAPTNLHETRNSKPLRDLLSTILRAAEGNDSAAIARQMQSENEVYAKEIGGILRKHKRVDTDRNRIRSIIINDNRALAFTFFAPPINHTPETVNGRKAQTSPRHENENHGTVLPSMDESQRCLIFRLARDKQDWRLVNISELNVAGVIMDVCRLFAGAKP